MQKSKTLEQDRGNIREVCLRTKLARITFVAGLTLMALCCSMADAPMWAIAAAGISGSVLALGSIRWTGWGDW